MKREKDKRLIKGRASIHWQRWLVLLKYMPVLVVVVPGRDPVNTAVNSYLYSQIQLDET